MRTMRTATEIFQLFTQADSKTVIRKANLRTLFESGMVFVNQMPNRKWIADLDEIIRLFAKRDFEKIDRIPRLRSFEESIDLAREELPKYKVTLQLVTDIRDSGNIKVIFNGNRWIVNFDELVSVLKDTAPRR